MTDRRFPQTPGALVETIADIVDDCEGATVVMTGSNADFNGLPNECIAVCADWTDWRETDFRADTWSDCLQLALDARAAFRAGEAKRAEAGRSTPTPPMAMQDEVRLRVGRAIDDFAGKLHSEKISAILEAVAPQLSTPASEESWREGVEAAARKFLSAADDLTRRTVGSTLRFAEAREALRRALSPSLPAAKGEHDPRIPPMSGQPRVNVRDFVAGLPTNATGEADVRERAQDAIDAWAKRDLVEYPESLGGITSWSDRIAEALYDAGLLRTPDPVQARPSEGPTDEQIAEWKRLADAASAGPWEADDELDRDAVYGHGDEDNSGFHKSKMYGPDGKVLFDSLNSDACLVHEEYDEDGIYAWDDVAKRNFAFIAAARLAVPALIAALSAERKCAKEAELEAKSCAEIYELCAHDREEYAVKIDKLEVELSAERERAGKAERERLESDTEAASLESQRRDAVSRAELAEAECANLRDIIDRLHHDMAVRAKEETRLREALERIVKADFLDFSLGPDRSAIPIARAALSQTASAGSSKEGGS